MARSFVSLRNSKSTNPLTRTPRRLIRRNDSNASEESKSTAQCFIPDRCLVYRAVHDESRGVNNDGEDITAGNLDQRHFKTKYEVYYSIRDHIKRHEVPSPWISVTPDLIRAMARAGQNRQSGKTGVRIFVIDATKLVNIFGVQEALKYLKSPQAMKYNTEWLVWQRISAEAVVCCWYLEKLEKSTLHNLFPWLKPRLEDWPTASQAQKNLKNMSVKQLTRSATLPKIAHLVTRRLGMDPNLFTTKQVVMTMLGWSRQKCTMKQLHTFEINITGRLKVDWTLYRLSKRDPHIAYRAWLAKREPKSTSNRSVEEILKRLIKNDQSSPVDSRSECPLRHWLYRFLKLWSVQRRPVALLIENTQRLFLWTPIFRPCLFLFLFLFAFLLLWFIGICYP